MLAFLYQGLVYPRLRRLNIGPSTTDRLDAEQLLRLVRDLRVGPLRRPEEAGEFLLVLGVEGVLIAGVGALEREVKRADQVVVFVPRPCKISFPKHSLAQKVPSPRSG